MLGENKLEDARICLAMVRNFEGFIQMIFEDVKGILCNATICLGDKEFLGIYQFFVLLKTAYPFYIELLPLLKIS